MKKFRIIAIGLVFLLCAGLAAFALPGPQGAPAPPAEISAPAMFNAPATAVDQVVLPAVRSSIAAESETAFIAIRGEALPLAAALTGCVLVYPLFLWVIKRRRAPTWLRSSTEVLGFS